MSSSRRLARRIAGFYPAVIDPLFPEPMRMNLHRRDFLRASAATGIAAAFPFPAFAAIDPKLAATLDAIAWDVLEESPETMSQLGLDTGAHAAARGNLADRSPAARARTVAGIAKHRHLLAAV